MVKEGKEKNNAHKCYTCSGRERKMGGRLFYKKKLVRKHRQAGHMLVSCGIIHKHLSSKEVVGGLLQSDWTCLSNEKSHYSKTAEEEKWPLHRLKNGFLCQALSSVADNRMQDIHIHIQGSHFWPF